MLCVWTCVFVWVVPVALSSFLVFVPDYAYYKCVHAFVKRHFLNLISLYVHYVY